MFRFQKLFKCQIFYNFRICLNLYFKMVQPKKFKTWKITRYNEKVKNEASRTLIPENTRKGKQ
jgi:hypothetical protein